ncbi:helix-turn-helix domain-containing protein [Halovenus marina]|uniref:helix-turn-helix domain-containing protein n=1 Tax=Halovenus marina TaxID=3396621 RepID=UPI003F575A79
MSADDPSNDEPAPLDSEDSTGDVRDRLEQEADRAIEQFDESIVDLLSWILDTETRARIYIALRQHPDSTSEEVADETGLYPSTVREALAQLHAEGTVTRRKRESDGAGNNPYEYSAISPSDLVSDAVDDVQSQLNAVFNLDCQLGSASEPDTESVTITVTEESESGATDESGS